MRSDEFRAPLEVFVWLAKLLRWGNFKRVAKPLYYRLDHPRSFTSAFDNLAEDRKRAIWTTLFTGLLDAAMPLCHTPEERLFFQQTIIDRIVVFSRWTSNEPNSSGKLMAECLERLRHEGNTHLLRREELPQILQELKRRWTLRCSSGPEYGDLFIECTSSPEWEELFIQRPECGESFINSVIHSRR